jgi:hypothetical protein
MRKRKRGEGVPAVAENEAEYVQGVEPQHLFTKMATIVTMAMTTMTLR